MDPYAVCTKAVARKNNPRLVALYAKGPRTPVLKYVGGIKFAARGTPIRFESRLQALALARSMMKMFPVLRRYRLWAA